MYCMRIHVSLTCIACDSHTFSSQVGDRRAGPPLAWTARPTSLSVGFTQTSANPYRIDPFQFVPLSGDGPLLESHPISPITGQMRGESVTEWCQCVYMVVHALSDANVGVLGLTSCECSVGSLCWLILLTVWNETLGLRFVFWTPSAHLHSA